MSGEWWNVTRVIAGLAATCLAAGCAASRPASLAKSQPRRELPTPSVSSKYRLGSPERSRRENAAESVLPARIKLTAHDDEADAAVAAIATADELSPAAGQGSDSPAKPAAGTHLIDLETALQLTSGQNPQVAFARERIEEAFAQLDRAQILWLPSLRAGVTYDKHDGSTQQVQGDFINSSRTALFTGFGGVMPGAATPAIPGLYANFHLVDAIFQPRIAERTAASRQSAATAATNDALLESALAYLELLRAAQDLAIAADARDHTRRLVELTAEYARAGKGTEADHDRSVAEEALRLNDVQRSQEAVRVASARLAQQLSLDALLTLEPREPTVVPIELVSLDLPAAELVARGLSQRPEVSENRALVCEAVEKLRREQYAPLVPSVLLGIGYGGFGGGTGGSVASFNNSFDSVVGAFWEVRNLGFGEQAARGEAQSRLHQAQWKEVAALDRVAREVVEARVQAQSRREQIATAQAGVEAATASYERNLDRISNAQGLPIEVLQAIQALAQARRDLLRAIVAYNEAQFRLHRALGWPTDRS